MLHVVDSRLSMCTSVPQNCSSKVFLNSSVVLGVLLRISWTRQASRTLHIEKQATCQDCADAYVPWYRRALRTLPSFPRIHCRPVFSRHGCTIVARMLFRRSSKGTVVFHASSQCSMNCAATGQEAKYTATFHDMIEIYL